MASNNPEKQPQYEDVKPASTTNMQSSSQGGWGNINISEMLESSGISLAARRASGAGEYFRNTILANVERLAGDAAMADEKERLARIGLQQMLRGRSEEHTHTPPVTEDHAPQEHAMGSTVPPGYFEPARPSGDMNSKS